MWLIVMMFTAAVVIVQGMESLLLPALLGINSKIIRQEDQGEI